VTVEAAVLKITSNPPTVAVTEQPFGNFGLETVLFCFAGRKPNSPAAS
jgi:hypothetical protein